MLPCRTSFGTAYFMDKTRIEQLVAVMPAQNAYTRRTGAHLAQGIDAPAEVVLFAHGMNDPMFGWVFVKSFLDQKQDLPCDVVESPLLRAFAYFRYANRDPHVRQAFQLRTHAEKLQRAMIQCMLLIEKYSLEHIASEMMLDLDVVEIYQTLFWNVRDRMRDKVYLTSLVYPQSTQVLYASNYQQQEDFVNIAMRAAVGPGMDTVREFLGLACPTKEFEAEAFAKAFEAQVLSTATHAARLGYLHQQNVPAISGGRLMVQSTKMGGNVSKDDDSRVGLGSFGMRASTLEHFRRIAESDVQYRLRLQQISAQNELLKDATSRG